MLDDQLNSKYVTDIELIMLAEDQAAREGTLKPTTLPEGYTLEVVQLNVDAQIKHRERIVADAKERNRSMAEVSKVYAKSVTAALPSTVFLTSSLDLNGIILEDAVADITQWEDERIVREVLSDLRRRYNKRKAARRARTGRRK